MLFMDRTSVCSTDCFPELRITSFLLADHVVLLVLSSGHLRLVPLASGSGAQSRVAAFLHCGESLEVVLASIKNAFRCFQIRWMDEQTLVPPKNLVSAVYAKPIW